MIFRCGSNPDHVYWTANAHDQWTRVVRNIECRYLTLGSDVCRGSLQVVDDQDGAREAAYLLGGLDAVRRCR